MSYLTSQTDSMSQSNMLDGLISQYGDGQQGSLFKRKDTALSERLWLKMVVKQWRKYTRKIRHDKQLFFAIRDFIVRRLLKKAMRGIKINYAHCQLIKALRMRSNLALKQKVLAFCKHKFYLRLKLRSFLGARLTVRLPLKRAVRAFK